MLVKLLSFPVRSYWVDESRFQIDKFFCLLLQVLYPKLPPNVSDLEFFGHFFCLLNFFDNILCGQPFPPPRSMEPLLDVIIKILITKSCWLGVPHHRGPPSLSSRRGKWFLFKRSQGLLMPHSLTLMPPLWFFFHFIVVIKSLHQYFTVMSFSQSLSLASSENDKLKSRVT